MKNIVEKLMDLPIREKTIRRVEERMKAGEVREYPLYLEKGDCYFVEAQGSKDVKHLTCCLMNGSGRCRRKVCSLATTVFTIIPEENGFYNFSLAIKSTDDNTESGKVTISLKKEYTPPWTETRMGV